MSCCLFRVSHRDSYPPTATEYAGSLVNRIDLSGISLMNLLSRDAQISPDKNVNFPYTNAAFTLPHEPVGSHPRAKPYMRFLFIISYVCHWASFRPLLAERPCLRLVLLLVSITMNTSRLSYRGLSPHKFTPVPGVNKLLSQTRNKRGLIFIFGLYARWLAWPLPHVLVVFVRSVCRVFRLYMSP